MAYPLGEVDEEFLASAPRRHRYQLELPVPAARVWDEAMAGDAPLRFTRAVSVRWTSGGPRGIGTTRLARVLGAIRLRERYFVWEEQRRTAFMGTAITAPLFKRFAEDYVVEPLGADRCRFTWTFCVDPIGPAPLAAAPAPIERALFASLVRDTRRHFGG